MAAVVLILFVFLHLFTNNAIECKSQDFYTAAVVEFDPKLNVTVSVRESIEKNSKKYVEIIKKANEYKVDIIVFPEMGLSKMDNEVFFKVPNPDDKVVPLQNDTFDIVLRNISKAAADFKMYVVINLHEIYTNAGKTFKYNTNVVFDRNGTVIARYRKYNLFGEKPLNITPKPEHVYFDTDFGVRFGTFICFDIVFEDPAVVLVKDYNITDIVYPTAWFSELPFSIGIQEQYSWSYATNTNFLGAGLNGVDRSHTGSGIYAGRKGSVIYTQTRTTGTKLLIGTVPKIGSARSVEKGQILSIDESEVKELKISHEDLDKFKTKLIEPTKLNATSVEEFNVTGSDVFIKGLKKQFLLNDTFCHEKFCCNFLLNITLKYYQNSYNFIKDDSFSKEDAYYHYRYRYFVFNGIRSHVTGHKTGEQVCGIVPCMDDKLANCGKINIGKQPDVHINDPNLGELTLYSTEFDLIKISGNFRNNRVLYLPSFLESAVDKNSYGQLFGTEDFKFNVMNGDKKEISYLSLVIDRRTKFIGGGILTRMFEFDQKPSNANQLIVQPCLFVLMFLFYSFMY